MSEPRVNGNRLWSTIMEMAKIGAIPNGGSRRLALTDEDRAGRDLFVAWCREAGCRVEVDRIGNIFAVREGRRRGAPCVLTGSHLDTQPHGGRFDGVYGVLAGLEAIRALNEHGIETQAPIAVVNWTNEEGVRFSPGSTGSLVFAGLLTVDSAFQIECVDGPQVGAELQRIGYAGTIPPAALPVSAYVELHIEQGPVLEKAGKAIAVVEGIQGVRWFAVHIDGAARHAGTTPMSDRRDSFMAAARLALAMREAACKASADIRFTVGRVRVDPGSPNTVPGHAEFSIDLRHPSEDVLATVEGEITRLARALAPLEGVQARVETLMRLPPVRFDPGCIAVIAGVAERAALPFERMLSGAFHDASNVARVVPAAMIFVPCRNGISHNEGEWAEPEHLAVGCQVLTSSLVELASRSGSA